MNMKLVGHQITPMLDKRRVLAANYAFYAAYRFADFEAMDALWSRTRSVAAILPDGHEIFGREAVMELWRELMEARVPPDIRPREPVVIGSEKAALVFCVEDRDESRTIATNVFVKERYDWRMTHHQSGELSSSTHNH